MFCTTPIQVQKATGNRDHTLTHTSPSPITSSRGERRKREDMYIFLFISLNQFQRDSGVSIAFGVFLVGVFFWYVDKVCFVFGIVCM